MRTALRCCLRSGNVLDGWGGRRDLPAAGHNNEVGSVYSDVECRRKAHLKVRLRLPLRGHFQIYEQLRKPLHIVVQSSTERPIRRRDGTRVEIGNPMPRQLGQRPDESVQLLDVDIL